MDVHRGSAERYRKCVGAFHRPCSQCDRCVSQRGCQCNLYGALRYADESYDDNVDDIYRDRPAPASTPVVAASVTLDPATGLIATLVPQSALTAGVTYTATIEGGANGVKDLAVPADTMVSNFTWSFTVGSGTSGCLAPISLGSAAPFGDFGGSAGTTNSGILTVINGDLGTTAVSTLVTGFNDTNPGCTYTEVPGADIGAVNGLIYTAPPPPTVMCPNEGTAATAAIAMQARADAY